MLGYFFSVYIVVHTTCEYAIQAKHNITILSELMDYINTQKNGKEMLEYVKIYISYKESVSIEINNIQIIRNVLFTTLVSVIIKGVLSLSNYAYAMCVFLFVILYPVLSMNIPTSRKELYSQFLHKITLEEQARKIKNI